MRKPTLTLPLSWTYSIRDFHLDKIDLFPFKASWFALGNITEPGLIEFIKSSISRNSRRIIVRGCDDSTANELSKLGFETILTAKEASFLDLENHFNKRSLKELVRRGKRFGEVKEYSYSDEQKLKFETFKMMSTHSEEPQLKYLYQTGFESYMRLFILESEEGKWLSALTISQNGPSKMQAESMLRRRGASIGVMEALIYETIKIIMESGYNEFSLGEVPFILNKSHLQPFTKGYLVNKIGRSVKIGYNYEGLYFFKNKFSPHWRNIYLCSYPKIYFRDLFAMAFKSNIIKLLAYKLFH